MAETTPPSPATLDADALATLLRIGGGDASFVQEMVQIFLEDTPPRIVEIEQGLARGDLTAVTKAAHSIKGGASNFGATRFRELAEQLEHRSKTGDVAALPETFAALQAEYPCVVAALRAVGSPA